MDALRQLYPNIVRTLGDIAYDEQGNVVSYDLEAVKAKEIEIQQAEVAAKASALSKLTALGLTQDEVKALLG
jgi:3-deoxy-D-arabino-heptulosonate 7-phosphate (DAHP) synthase class II